MKFSYAVFSYEEDFENSISLTSAVDFNVIPNIEDYYVYIDNNSQDYIDFFQERYGDESFIPEEELSGSDLDLYYEQLNLIYMDDWYTLK